MDIFNVSQRAADTAFGVFNVIAIVGAILVFVGTAGIFWSGGIRERYADDRIARNEKETAQANERAANAELETAKANLATEQLRQQITGRILSTEQAHKLRAALAPLRTLIPLVQVTRLGDMEAGIYADQTIQAIKSSGMNVSVSYAGTISPPIYGIRIEEPTGALAKAFAAAGLDVHSYKLPANQPAHIIIGLKLPPK